MQTFPTPAHRVKFSRLNGEILHQCENLFDSFPIHSIQLLLPSSSSHIVNYEDILVPEENIYFIIKDITAKCLIENTFLEHFVKSGSLLAVSHNARIEVDNFLTIVPKGKLVLSLEKSISQGLALHKENPQKKKRRRKSFETFIIDLTCPELYPGKKFYGFISTELSKIDYIKFTLLLKWKPYGNICSQSLKTYFLNQGYECIACKPNCKYSSKISVPVPQLKFDLFDENIYEDVLEWVGVHICGIEYSSTENEYVSKFMVPESSEIVNRLHSASFEGFYSKAEVIPVINKIRNITERDCTIPFAVLCLSGFQDSYVVSNGFQHFSSSDKLICLVLFPSSNYWLITLNAR